MRTVLDCARTLPFCEALAVIDSALRKGLVTSDELLAAAIAVRGPGRARGLRVVEAGDARAASVLESDSFAYHASREALRRDCRRYTNLAMRALTLLRCSWEDVLDEGWVGDVLASVGRGRTGRQNP